MAEILKFIKLIIREAGLKSFSGRLMFTFFVCLVSVSLLSGQEFGKLDTLRKELTTAPNDSTRASVSYKISSLLVEDMPDSALRYSDSTIAIAAAIRDTGLLIDGYIQRGIAYDNLGKISESLKAQTIALDLASTVHDDFLVACCYTNLGLLYSRQDPADPKVMEYYRKALAIRERDRDQDLPSGYLNLANAFFDLQQYDSAIVYCNKCLSSIAPDSDPEEEAFALNSMGNIYFMKKDYAASISYFERGKTIKEKYNDKRGLVSSYANIGEAYGEMGKYDLALENLNVAIALAHSIKNYFLQREVYLIISNVYAKMGDYHNAYESYKMYTAYRDSVFSERKAKELLDLQTKYETAEKVKENELLKQNNDIQAESIRRKDWLNIVTGGFLLLALVGAFFIFRAYAQKKKANLEISRQKIELEVKNKEVRDSITYAKRIQYTLLAHDDLLKQNLSEHFVLFRPKDIVSGDFYWATEKDGSFYLAVCDSTGHGVPGAFMSLLNTSFLNEAITEKHISSPEKILNYVRDRLVNSVSKEGAQDGMDGVLLRMVRENGKSVITYAAANNNPVVVRNGELIELVADKMPVGLSNERKDFSLGNITAEKGDMLYLFTDGYADQFGGPKGKKFKYKQLYELIRNNAGLDMKTQSRSLETTLDDWRGALEQVDDICVIGIRV